MYRCPAGTCRKTKSRYESHGNDGFGVRLFFDLINNRLKVQEYHGDDLEAMARYIVEMARENKLGKILFNAGQRLKPVLEGAGYNLEGVYPGFFHGTTAYGYSFFVDPERRESRFLQEEEEILRSILNRVRKDLSQLALPKGMFIQVATGNDIPSLVALYQKIFSTYPSPLLDPGYVEKVMASHVLFAAVFHEEFLVSAASADMDIKNKNAEITDCATLPEYRGRGLLTCLIKYLEQEMQLRGIGCLYSLARAGSYGMNAALYNLGYEFTGRFINNCHIGGRYEDMNLWVKKNG